MQQLTAPLSDLYNYQLLSSAAFCIWNSTTSITLCMALGFVYRPFKNEHIGHIYSYNRRVSEAEFTELQNSTEAQCQLWHALKW